METKPKVPRHQPSLFKALRAENSALGGPTHFLLAALPHFRSLANPVFDQTNLVSLSSAAFHPNANQRDCLVKTQHQPFLCYFDYLV
jgi:hypothetical protein